MALGQNRENDTPIGGLPEFRGNLQGGGVFSSGEVPVFDGEKFVPGINQVLVLGYGGLALGESLLHTADGSIIDNWGNAMPLGGVPQQMTPDPVTGIITVNQDGVYDLAWTANLAGLANNEDYFFELVVSGGPTGFGTHIVGSNNVSSQSGGFSLMVQGSVGSELAVTADNLTDSTFDIVSMSLTCSRIG